MDRPASHVGVEDGRKEEDSPVGNVGDDEVDKVEVGNLEDEVAVSSGR